jgi:DNA-binding LytR/AlgR family response regulator
MNEESVQIAKGKQDGMSAYFRVKEREITYIEADKDYYYIYLIGQKDAPIKIHGTLGSAMVTFHSLVKPHKSYLVNLNQVFCVATDPEDNYAKVVFRDGTHIKFSKSKSMYFDFMQRMNSYATEE